MDQILRNNQLMRLSTYLTVAAVSLIIIAKLYGWFVTESVTVLASLLDSLLDACVSVMNLLAVHYSLQPADHEHRFGHGKAEDIAAFIQSVFFGISGIIVTYTAVERFFHPSEQLIESSATGVSVLLFSIIITVIIMAFQQYVIKRTRSIAIETDHLHYATDLLANILAIIGIVIVHYLKLSIVDNITAIIIACFIMYAAIKMFKKALNNLMDHELNEEDRKIIIDVIRNHNGARGFHDLKTRHAGTKVFIQFHMELDNNLTLEQAHIIAVEVENLILAQLPHAEIIIHLDPEDVDEKVSYTD